MRSTWLPVLGLALLAGACDTGKAPQEQATGDAASAPSPDEAAPALPTTPADRIDRSHKGEAAPTLAFTGPDGKPLTLAAFRGKPVLLNLWATWCGPCVKELPTLDALAKREGGRLQVVTLSQDTDPAKVAPFLSSRGLTTIKPYTDARMAWVPAIASNLPTTFLFDSNGKEVLRTLGDLDWTGEVAAAAIAEAR